MIDLKWFNLHPVFFNVLGINFKFFNAFVRDTADYGMVWGFGLIQIRGWHLLYIGLDTKGKQSLTICSNL